MAKPQRADQRRAKKPEAEEQDGEAAMEAAVAKLWPMFQKLQAANEAQAERKRAEVLARPPVDANTVLTRDPETGDRRVFSGVTLHQGHHIRFKVMRYGDLLEVPEDIRYSDSDRVDVLDWPAETHAAILRSCLVEPDLVGLCEQQGAEFGVEWLSENVAWPVVADYVECIARCSQPKLLSLTVEPADGEKKGPRDHSPTESPSDGSTTADTGTPTEVSTG